MTEEVLAALETGTPRPSEAVGAAISRPSPEDAQATSDAAGEEQSLSLRTSDRVTGVAIRTPGGQAGEEGNERERIATAVCALPRNDMGNGPQRGSFDVRAHFDSLCAQGEALRAEFPDFDLAAALRDPAFLRLTAPALGVGVREAWSALHPEALDERAARRAAEDAQALLARAAAAGALRPREGGGLDAAALTRRDPGGLSRGERERLKERIREAASRGEKLYP